MRNDTLLENDHRVSTKCRFQLRSEFLALEDTITMDADFAKDCKADIDSRCKDVKPGPREVSYNIATRWLPHGYHMATTYSFFTFEISESPSSHFQRMLIYSDYIKC